MKIASVVSRLSLVLLMSVSSLQADILIGFAGPMTGPRAWSGQQFQRGAEQAVADINTLGGVLGQRMALVVGDDASDPRHPLPQHATEGIDIGDGLLGAALKLLTRPGAWTGQGSGKADQNVSL